MDNDKDIKNKSKNNRESYPLDLDELQETNDNLTENTETEFIISDDSPLNKTAERLVALNIIKRESCKLSLNPCEMEFIINSVAPLTRTLGILSSVSFRLSNTIDTLSNNPIIQRKKSKIESTINLIYSLNDKCTDIYKVLKKRINLLLSC